MSKRTADQIIADQIIADLQLLSNDAKRKIPEIKHSCEHSIEITRPYGSTNKSSTLKKSTQTPPPNGLKRALTSHPEFIGPSIMACNSKNPKIITHGVKMLHKLIQFQLLPANESTPDDSPDPLVNVVDALIQASTYGDDESQIKILQLLPSLFQSYSARISGDLLSDLLSICTILQNSGKGTILVNTAQATFPQLINIAIEKVTDLDASNDKQEKVYEINVSKDETKKVGIYEYDVQRVVSDVCSLIEHRSPKFLKIESITEEYGLEILENLIKNNSCVFSNHNELSFILRDRVSPILLEFVSSNKDFKLMVNVSRLILILLTEEFEVMKSESELTLQLLVHILSKDSGAPPWKRTLILEIFWRIFQNPSFLKKLYSGIQESAINENKKSIINDFFSLCYAYVDSNRQLLNAGDLIQSPTAPNYQTDQEALIQRKGSSLNGLISLENTKHINFIESIDKLEPPQAPESYNLYIILQILVSLSDCIQTEVLSLMKVLSSSSSITTDLLKNLGGSHSVDTYIFVCNLIRSTWRFLLDISSIFIRSTLDNKLFLSILKVLENLCYCAGILSLHDVKHAFLKCLSVISLKLDGRMGFQSKVMSISESIVGSISSTLGNAVSNMSNHGTTESSTGPPIKLYSRTINSRQILCFYTLVRLAVSLGSQLHDDWKIVMISLQWISYYIDGPTGFKAKDIPPISSYITGKDLKTIENSLNELNKSILNQNSEVFKDIITAITSLSYNIMESSGGESSFGEIPVLNDEEIQPCAFNKNFYVNKLTDLCNLNPLKFLIETDQNLTSVNIYFSTISKNRSLPNDSRSSASRSFNMVAKLCAETGFENENEEVQMKAELNVLNILHEFLHQISELPVTTEIYTANCEGEMYLQTLQTLKSIIDRYGNQIKKSWNIVTEMLDFPFLIIQNISSDFISEKMVKEMIVLILKESFETLKLILDDVLQTIPKTQIKNIIETLYKFVSQSLDLNISFNSVSYFWLISDFIKDKLDLVETKPEIDHKIISETELLDIVFQPSDSDHIYYQYLWIYLVLQLAKTAPDPRAQVRNGAIITTFNVIESFSPDTSTWNLLYFIVVQPVIFQIKVPTIGLLTIQDQRDWMESFTNVSTGISKLAILQTNNSTVNDLRELNLIWNGIINYFTSLLNLDYNWIDLNTQIFKNYNEILEAFNLNNELLSEELLETLFGPWSSVKINYNLNDPSAYQKFLCQFIACFKISFSLFEPIMTSSKFEQMLSILNACVKYPILVDSRSDDKKCTPTQKAVLDTLAELTFTKSQSSYESILIQQLNVIITLPFQTRDLIIKKLGDKGVKIPTFIAASYYGLQILEKHLDTITDLSYLNDRTISKAIKSLIESSKVKNEILIHRIDNSSNDSEVYFWMFSFDILVRIIMKTLNMVMATNETEFNTKINIDSLNQLIPLCVVSFDCCFILNNTTKLKNDFDLAQYHKLNKVLLKFFTTYFETDKCYQTDRSNVQHYISAIWKASSFYAPDSIFKSILPDEKYFSSKSISQLTSVLADDSCWDIYGSTDPLIISPRLLISTQCFTDLVELLDDSKYPHISKLVIPFFISRCSLGLRKFLLETRLLGGAPIPEILLVELAHIIHGVEQMITAKGAPALLGQIYPMLVRSIPKTSNKEMENELVQICTNLGRCNL